MQTSQLSVFVLGHAFHVRPPLDPQPVTAAGSLAKANVKAIVEVTPVMVVAVGDVHVLAEIDDVGIAIVTLPIGGLPPFATGSTPLTSAVRLTAPIVQSDSFTPSTPIPGATTWMMPAADVAGSLKRYGVPPLAGPTNPAVPEPRLGNDPVPCARLTYPEVVPVPITAGVIKSLVASTSPLFCTCRPSVPDALMALSLIHI